MTDPLRVTYRLAVDRSAAESRAEEIAREQTVEVPRAALRDDALRERIVGRVEAIDEEAGGSRIAIAYPIETTGHDPAQLLNVVFGMTSLQPDAECMAIEPPASLCRALGGPRFGIEGLRKAACVEARALTCTAVKPMGLSPDALAGRLRIFARGGLDVVKDDQGLADHAFCPFEARVRACLEAVEEVAQETGRRTLYAPNLIGAPDTLLRALKRFYNLGICPEWWKLQPMTAEQWRAVDALIAERDSYCRGVVLLGLNTTISRLAAGFREARESRTCRGFAVGRTIFLEPSRQWLAGKIDDETLVRRVRAMYEVLIRAWRDARAPEATTERAA